MKLFNKIKNYCSAALLIGAVATVTLNSCTEKIDESDLYTFTGEMMLDHLENHPEVFSSYLSVLGKVHTSKRSSSTVRELLGARGHYTCFAPTNEAIQEYLDSLCGIGQLESNSLDQISDSVAEALVFNSIIQNGESEAFLTTDFAEGSLPQTNMNDRYITISYGNDADNNPLIYVNLNSLIINGDIEVENGCIHTINKVLSPSNATGADLVIKADNMQFFGNLLMLTGWDLKTSEFKDEAWEERHQPENGGDGNIGVFREITKKKWNGDNTTFKGVYPAHRYIGYTIFVEPDDVYAKHNITDLESLKQWVKENNYYDDDTSMGNATSWGDDYTNDYNWLNQFVAYHILPEKLNYDRMVIFSNEYGRWAGEVKDGYNEYKVNVWEYWETIGIQRRSLKITGYRGNTRYINRASVYRNSDYAEINADEGIEISQTNGNNVTDGLNGIYYPISDILIWNENVPRKVLNERMRYDVTSLLPELSTNNIRQNRHNENESNWYFTDDYFENLTGVSKETILLYLPNTNKSGGGSAGWLDYQTDEFNIQGTFDFTMKLPPVPYTGTYEIRYGINANDDRGMAQIYLGTNKNNLPAIGIPIDLRRAAVTAGSTGWVADKASATDAEIQENTKSMRNLGFMKGPKYMCFAADGKGLPRNTGRDYELCLRKIIYTGTLEAGKTYYIRFKSVLNGTGYELFYDYLEFVPKTIYTGDEKPEDVW